MKVISEVEKGDQGEVKFFHVDCPLKSDTQGGIIEPRSGICEDCGVEIPKNLMDSTSGQTLRNLLNKHFQPNKEGMSAIIRVSGSRKDTLGPISTEGTSNNPTEA